MGELRWVLLAEDDDDIRQMIRRTLEEESEGLELQIVEARDGLEAISKANNQQFHCVVTDLNMPRSGGVELIRALQTTPLNAGTPTIVVTGSEDDAFSERYSHIRVVSKPFTPESLAQIVVREIKLGKMDDRIAVHLLNPFLNACSELSLQELKLTPQISQPAVRRSGDPLVGDMHCTLLITTGVIKNRFTFSFDLGLLEHIRSSAVQDSKTHPWANAPLKTVANQVCLSLFDRASGALLNVMGSQPRLASTSVAMQKSDVEYIDLIGRPGAQVVLQTPHGRIVATAFAQTKTRRT